MTRVILPCLFAIITFSFPASSAPYDYDYEDYGYGSYSSHKDKTSPIKDVTYPSLIESFKAHVEYLPTPPPYYRTTPSPYKYNYRDYDYDYKINNSVAESTDVFSFLPPSVTDWFGKTLNKVGEVVSGIAKSKEKIVLDLVDDMVRKGDKIAAKLWDDVMNRTRDKQHDLMGTISDFERKLFAIPTSVQRIWGSNEPMTAAESVENKETLADIKNKLDAFENKVEEEIENEKDLPFALRNQLLKFITASRGIVKEMGGEEETFWSKLKLMEKEMYQFQLNFAETSDVLKGKLDSLFNALKKVDLPKLKSVKDGEKKLNEVDTFLNKLLTE